MTLIEAESRDFNEIDPKVQQAKLALMVAKLNNEDYNKSRQIEVLVTICQRVRMAMDKKMRIFCARLLTQIKDLDE